MARSRTNIRRNATMARNRDRKNKTDRHDAEAQYRGEDFYESHARARPSNEAIVDLLEDDMEKSRLERPSKTPRKPVTLDPSKTSSATTIAGRTYVSDPRLIKSKAESWKQYKTRIKNDPVLQRKFLTKEKVSIDARRDDIREILEEQFGSRVLTVNAGAASLAARKRRIRECMLASRKSTATYHLVGYRARGVDLYIHRGKVHNVPVHSLDSVTASRAALGIANRKPPKLATKKPVEYVPVSQLELSRVRAANKAAIRATIAPNAQPAYRAWGDESDDDEIPFVRPQAVVEGLDWKACFEASRLLEDVESEDESVEEEYQDGYDEYKENHSISQEDLDAFAALVDKEQASREKPPDIDESRVVWENTMKEVTSFLSTSLSGVIEGVESFNYDTLVRLLGELRLFSLVKPNMMDRTEYIALRLCLSSNGGAALLRLLLASTGVRLAVSALCEAMKKTPVVKPQGFAESLASVLESTAFDSRSMGHAFFSMAMGGMVFVASKGTFKFDLAEIYTIARAGFAIPDLSDPTAALSFLARQGPKMIAAIAAAIATRSLLPLRVNGDVALYKRYCEVHTLMGSFQTGTYPEGVTYRTLCILTEEVLESHKLALSRDTTDKDINNRYLRLVGYAHTLSLANRKALREAPMCIALHALPGAGKSYLVATVGRQVVEASGEEYRGAGTIYTHNPTSKFADGLKTSSQILLADDVANAKQVEGCQNPATAFLIEFVNNINIPTNQAAVELKGVVYPAFCAVLITTNVKDLCASRFSNAPASILRRIGVMVDVTTKPNCRREEGSQELKPGLECEEGQFCNYWDYRLQRAKVLSGPDASGRDYVWVDVEHPELTKGRCYDIHAFLTVVRDVTMVHVNNQRLFLERVTQGVADHTVPLDRDALRLRHIRAKIAQGEVCSIGDGIFIRNHMENFPAEGAFVEPQAAVDSIKKVSRRVTSDMTDIWAGMLALPEILASTTQYIAGATSSLTLTPGELVFHRTLFNFTRCNSAFGLPTRVRLVCAIIGHREVHHRGRQLMYLLHVFSLLLVLMGLGAVTLCDEGLSGLVLMLLCFWCATFAHMVTGTIFTLIDCASTVPHGLEVRMKVAMDRACTFLKYCAAFYAMYRMGKYIMPEKNVLIPVSVSTREAEQNGSTTTTQWVNPKFFAKKSPILQYVTPQGVTEMEPDRGSTRLVSSTEPAVTTRDHFSEAAATVATDDLMRLAVRMTVVFTANVGGVALPFNCLIVGNHLLATNAHVLRRHFAGSDGPLQVMYSVCSRNGEYATPRCVTLQPSNVWYVGQASDLAILKFPMASTYDFSPFLAPDCFSVLDQRRMIASGSICTVTPEWQRFPLRVRFEKFDLLEHTVYRACHFGTQVKEENFHVVPMLGATRAGHCGSPAIMSYQVGMTRRNVVLGIHSGIIQHGGRNFAAITSVTSSHVLAAQDHFSGVSPVNVFPQGAVPRLFMQPARLVIDPSRDHPSVPTGGGAELIGTLVIADGPGARNNPASINTSRTTVGTSPLTRDPELFAETQQLLGDLQAKACTDASSQHHFDLNLQGIMKERPPKRFHQNILDLAIADMCATVDAAVGEKRSSPLTLCESINGAIRLGVRIKSLPLSTSSGFGLKGPKVDHMVVACCGCIGNTHCNCSKYHVTEAEYVGEKEYYYPDADLLASINTLQSCLERGDHGLAIFVGSLKLNEAIALDKKKLRMFFVGTAALSIVMRQYYSPITSMMAADIPGFECCAGISTTGTDWNQLAIDLMSHTYTRILAGDFKGWDMSLPCELTVPAYGVFAHAGWRLGYDEKSLDVMHCIAANVTRPIFIIQGVVWRMCRASPSGVICTTQINSMVNSLLFRYTLFHQLWLVHTTVKEMQPALAELCATLESVLQGGHLATSLFRQIAYMRSYGDDMIHAVTDALSLAFESAGCSFTNLSILECADQFSMTYTSTDKGDSIQEYYTFAELTFLKHRFIYKPTIDRIVGEIDIASVIKCISFIRGKYSLNNYVQTCKSACLMFFAHCLDGEDGMMRYERFRHILTRAVLLKDPDVDPAALRDEMFSWAACLVIFSVREVELLEYEEELDEGLLCWQAPRLTVVRQGAYDDNTGLPAIGEETPAFSTIMAIPEENVVTMVDTVEYDGLEGFMEESKAPGVRLPGPGITMPPVDNHTDLSNWFERPILIASVPWALGSLLDLRLDPWSLFFANPVVADKLRYYYRFNGTMRIRVNISGTPFHYGSLRLTYRPHPGITAEQDPVHNAYVSTDTHPGDVSQARYMLSSQLTGVYLNPSMATSAEITAPLVHWRPGINLQKTSFNHIGEFCLTSFTDLRHANNGLDGCQINVYASMESATVDTATNFTYQGFTASDAKNKVATVISAGAMAMKMAHEYVIPALSTIAALGFSRPAEAMVPQEFRRIPFNLANTDVTDTVTRLSVNAGSEATIDPRVVGATPTDELVLKEVYQREAFVNSVVWEDQATNDGIFYCMVVPTMEAHTSLTTLQYTLPHVLLTPLSHVARSFHYWTGTIKFKVRVVASPYHKGRLRIWYNPSDYLAPLGTDIPYNIVTSVVLDLAEASEVELEVPWSQVADARRILALESSYQPWTNSEATFATVSQLFPRAHNGYIVIEVLNPLTCPGDACGVHVQTFIEGGDLAFYDPFLPSKAIVDSTLDRVEPQAYDPSCGEAIVSWRQLMKRYCAYRTASFTNTSVVGTTRAIVSTHLMYDMCPGYAPTTYVQASTKNFVNWTYATWAGLGFCLKRGSTRHKIIVGDNTPAIRTCNLLVAGRETFSAFGDHYSTYLLSGNDASTEAINSLFDTMSRGGQVAEDTVQSVLDIEMPFYSDYRAVGSRTVIGGAGSSDHKEEMTFRLHSECKNIAGQVLMRQFTSVGEDYNLMHYLHAPSVLVDTSLA